MVRWAATAVPGQSFCRTASNKPQLLLSNAFSYPLPTEPMLTNSGCSVQLSISTLEKEDPEDSVLSYSDSWDPLRMGFPLIFPGTWFSSSLHTCSALCASLLWLNASLLKKTLGTVAKLKLLLGCQAKSCFLYCLRCRWTSVFPRNVGPDSGLLHISIFRIF